jgi:hypothetical protein
MMAGDKIVHDRGDPDTPSCQNCGNGMTLYAMMSAPVGLPFAQFVCACGSSVTLPWRRRPTPRPPPPANGQPAS